MAMSTFQSLPCVSEDVARGQVASMLTQLASEKNNVKLINIDIRESNGMFIAIANYEVVEADLNVKKEEEDEKERRGEDQNAQNPDEEDDEAEGAVLHTALNGKNELLPEQTAATAFEPTTQAPEPTEPPLPPTGPEALKPDDEFLADKMKDDFAVAETPHTYNVNEHALVAERAASATSGLTPQQVADLKVEIERKLDEGIDPAIPIPDGADKPSATPPAGA